MSASDALLNIFVLFIVMTPFVLLAVWLIRRTHPRKHSGADKVQAYRILMIAWAVIALAVILLLYFSISLLIALITG